MEETGEVETAGEELNHGLALSRDIACGRRQWGGECIGLMPGVVPQSHGIKSQRAGKCIPSCECEWHCRG